MNLGVVACRYSYLLIQMVRLSFSVNRANFEKMPSSNPETFLSNSGELLKFKGNIDRLILDRSIWDDRLSSILVELVAAKLKPLVFGSQGKHLLPSPLTSTPLSLKYALIFRRFSTLAH